MIQRDLLDFLLDIIEAIDEIESFVAGINFEEFANNREKILAIVKLLEIIGEATKKIPEDLRDQYPDIPWRAVAGMRDVLVHQYWQVDVAVVWETVMESLPLLKGVIAEMIKCNQDRAIAVEQDNDLVWFWIGTQAEYDRPFKVLFTEKSHDFREAIDWGNSLGTLCDTPDGTLRDRNSAETDSGRNRFRNN